MKYKQETEKKEVLRQKIEDELADLGVQEPPPEIIDRLLLIEKNSRFNNDARMIREGFVIVLDKIKEELCLTQKMTEQYRQEGELAAYLHDIGKSGGILLNADGQLAVIKLFSADRFTYPIDPKITVGQAINECFSEERDLVTQNLSRTGVDEEMPMRQFYDMHAQWTRDILEKFAKFIPKRTRIVAASHHMDRGINPYNLTETEVPVESLIIGVLEEYINNLEEKILMVVDKYQAAIARGRANHSQAVDLLKKILSGKYEHDPIMNLVIDTVDKLGKAEALFPQTQDKYLHSD